MTSLMYAAELNGFEWVKNIFQNTWISLTSIYDIHIKLAIYQINCCMNNQKKKKKTNCMEYPVFDIYLYTHATRFIVSHCVIIIIIIFHICVQCVIVYVVHTVCTVHVLFSLSLFYWCCFCCCCCWPFFGMCTE